MNTVPLDLCQSDMERHGLTQCAYCEKIINQAEAAYHHYYDETGIQQVETFCPDTLLPELNCHHAWYIARLNVLGL